jgi:F420-dependent oxidoreductase-like protein
MTVGIFLEQRTTLDQFIADAAAVAARGFASVWTPQVFGADALTTLAMVGREVPNIELGTSVIPTYPRHPIALAAQALSVQEATGGRLALGIGLSHKIVIESIFGYSFDKSARHMEEYLSALVPLLHERKVSFAGETIKAQIQLRFPEFAPPPVLVAALGPKMLEITGRLADGTVTWMTGPATVADHIAPRITAAATAAGKPAPRIVVALPVSVTDDAAAARADAARTFAMYGQLPSYRAMLDREGAAGPADVAIVGDAATVRGEVKRCLDAGATEFVAAPFGNREATLDALADL